MQDWASACIYKEQTVDLVADSIYLHFYLIFLDFYFILITDKIINSDNGYSLTINYTRLRNQAC